MHILKGDLASRTLHSLCGQAGHHVFATEGQNTITSSYMIWTQMIFHAKKKEAKKNQLNKSTNYFVDIKAPQPEVEKKWKEKRSVLIIIISCIL